MNKNDPNTKEFLNFVGVFHDAEKNNIRDSGFGKIDKNGFEHFSSDRVMCDDWCKSTNYIDSVNISLIEVDAQSDPILENNEILFLPMRQQFLRTMTKSYQSTSYDISLLSNMIIIECIFKYLFVSNA